MALAAIVALSACEEPPIPYEIGDVVEEHYTEPVAVVNGVPIYGSTYEQILVIMRSQIPESHPDSVELYLSAKLRALERSIDEELLRQEASRRGYEPSQRDVARIYGERVEGAGSEEEYLAGARARQLSKSELLEALRRSVTIDRFVAEEVDSELTPSSGEVREFYDSRPDLFTSIHAASLSQIFVEAPPAWPRDRRAAALSRLSAALDRLEKGDSFEELAREISSGPNAESGGMLGFFERGALTEELDAVIFTLEPGEVSEIVETENGYHLLKVHERRGGELSPFEEVEEEARRTLLAEKRRAKLNELLESLRESASIERLLI
jgi:parvulin-like peptidyl-prolyl isomerase